jgi:hypothetical protein
VPARLVQMAPGPKTVAACPPGPPPTNSMPMCLPIAPPPAGAPQRPFFEHMQCLIAAAKDDEGAAAAPGVALRFL